MISKIVNDDDDDDGDGNIMIIRGSDGSTTVRRTPTMSSSSFSSKKKKRRASKAAKKLELTALERIARFNLRPREIREYLDRYVVRQDAAKKVLSVAVCDHYNVVRRCVRDPAEKLLEYSKPNILLLGPSGSGKTYIMRTLAKLLGVPLVKADATKFTETGIVGEDAEDLVRQLVDQADGDVDLASYGIIYVDEVDKLCKGESREGLNSGAGSSAGARGVQSTFLKVMEETEITINKGPPGLPAELFAQMGGGKNAQRISTQHILFIFSGAFTQLDARLRREREDSRGLGFLPLPAAPAQEGEAPAEAAPAGPAAEDSSSPASYLHKATSADFIAAGLEPEFIGRIPVRVAVEALSAADLEEILLSAEGSVLRQYERDFAGYGIELTVTRTAVREIAVQAAAEKTGARGLVTVLERTFRELKYELPCTGIDELVCDVETVKRPDKALARALASYDLARRDDVRRADVVLYEADFAAMHAPLTISFDDDSRDWLVARSRDGAMIGDEVVSPPRSVRTICNALFGCDAKLPDALRILSARAPNSANFTLPRNMLTTRDETIQEWLDRPEVAAPEAAVEGDAPEGAPDAAD